MSKSSDSAATQFLLWLMKDVSNVSAEIGTDRDKQLEKFVEFGFLKVNDCHFGNNYYVLTDARRILKAI